MKKGKINCRKCGTEIRRDRYNIYLVLERQDAPPSGEWQKSTDRTIEDICPSCENEMVKKIHAIFAEYTTLANWFP